MKTILTEELIKISHSKNKQLNNYKLDYIIQLLQPFVGTEFEFRKTPETSAIRFIIKKLPKVFNSASSGDSFWKERGWSDEEIYQKTLEIKKINSSKQFYSMFNYKTYMIKYGMDEQTARYQANKIRPIKKEYWLERGYSEEDAIKMANNSKHNNNINGNKKAVELGKKDYQLSTTIAYYTMRGYSEDEAKALLKERQTTFSLEKCIRRHGEEQGFLIWQDRQERWQNTLDSKTEEEKKKICEDKNSKNIKKFYKKFKDKNTAKKEFKNYIFHLYEYNIPESVEELLGELELTYGDRVSNKLYRPLRIILNSVPKYTLSYLEITRQQLEEIIRQRYSIITETNERIKNASMGYWQMYTEHGLLRSSNEIKFYFLLLENGYKIGEDFYIDRSYPGSPMRYDFYFPKYNKYVEICGFDNEEYIQKMKYKQSTFSAVLLYKTLDYVNFIESLKNDSNY